MVVYGLLFAVCCTLFVACCLVCAALGLGVLCSLLLGAWRLLMVVCCFVVVVFGVVV